MRDLSLTERIHKTIPWLCTRRIWQENHVIIMVIGIAATSHRLAMDFSTDTIMTTYNIKIIHKDSCKYLWSEVRLSWQSISLSCQDSHRLMIVMITMVMLMITMLMMIIIINSSNTTINHIIVKTSSHCIAPPWMLWYLVISHKISMA